MRSYLVGVLVITALPATALAEVMDKEPCPRDFWLWSLAVSWLGFAHCRTRLWLAPLALLPFLMAPPLLALAELGDPDVGPAMRRELGDAFASYRLHLVLSLALAALAPLAGGLLRWRDKRAGSLAP